MAAPGGVGTKENGIELVGQRGNDDSSGYKVFTLLQTSSCQSNGMLLKALHPTQSLRRSVMSGIYRALTKVLKQRCCWCSQILVPKETLGALRPGNKYLIRVLALDSSGCRLKILGPATFITEVNSHSFAFSDY